MSAVKEVIDELGLNIPIAGLAKDGKHRTSELLYGYPPQTIGLKQNTPLFRLLTASPSPSTATNAANGRLPLHWTR